MFHRLGRHPNTCRWYHSSKSNCHHPKARYCDCEQTKKTVSIFELTVPSEARIETSNKIKLEKYEHFKQDIKNYEVSVIPFEIGSHTGHISRNNKTNLNKLHKFCKPDIKLKKFKDNISAITSLSSYYVFNCRNQPEWESSDPISEPFLNQ